MKGLLNVLFAMPGRVSFRHSCGRAPSAPKKALAERRDLPKPALFQVFVEKCEDAAPCVIGADLVVAESDDA